MLKDIVEVHPLDDYQLHLRFEDDVEGVVDLLQIIQLTGVFAPLKDPSYFAQVRVNPDLGAICWPNNADVDTDVLYARITGEAIPTYEQEFTKNPAP